MDIVVSNDYLLEQIFSFIPQTDLIQCMYVSKKWYKVIKGMNFDPKQSSLLVSFLDCCMNNKILSFDYLLNIVNQKYKNEREYKDVYEELFIYIVNFTAEYGRLKLLKRANIFDPQMCGVNQSVSQQMYVSQHTLCMALKSGNLQCFEYLNDIFNNSPYQLLINADIEFIRSACKSHKLEVVKYVFEKCLSFEFEEGIYWACYYNDQDIIDYILCRTINENVYNSGMLGAAHGGQFDVFKFMIDKGADRFQDSLNLTTDPEIIRFLITSCDDVQITQHLINNIASETDHFELIDYIIVNNDELNFIEAFKFACKNKNTLMIEYLISKGYYDLGVGLKIGIKTNQKWLVNKMFKLGATASIIEGWLFTECKDMEIFHILNEHKPFNDQEYYDLLLLNIEYGKLELVKMILNRITLNQTQIKECILVVQSTGHIDILDLIRRSLDNNVY